MASEILAGGSGDDTLVGGGGLDVLAAETMEVAKMFLRLMRL